MMQTSIEDIGKRGGPLLVGGVDPGLRISGHALVFCGALSGGCEVLDCGTLSEPSGAGIDSVLNSWYKIGTELLGKPAYLVHIGVEGQWVPEVDARATAKQLRGLMGQINSTLEVAANRGAWIALAEARGWEAEKIHPSQWRRGLGRGGRGKRKTVKDRAVESVRLRERGLFRRIRLPGRIPDHLAEAILIAEYKAKKIQLKNISAAGGGR